MSKFNRWWSTLSAHIALPDGWKFAKEWANEAYHLRDDEITRLTAENERYRKSLLEISEYYYDEPDSVRIALKALEVKERTVGNE